ncbi:MAG: TlpA family protein disulfide reductase [Alphaproteobacteria bacterium]|nr:TlpA family protein disulfide reductase [Alphaproteobacteria bacterium]
MTSSKMKRFVQTGVRLGPCLIGVFLCACSEDEKLPTSERSTPAQVSRYAEDLPRNRWLTVDDAVPVSQDGGIVKDEADRPYGYAMLGKAAPAFSAASFGGGRVTQEIFRGKWTIVDIWGVWCGDCRVDAPIVEALARDLSADPELSFLSIHSPPSRERADEAYGQFGSLEAYFAARGRSYPTAVDTDGAIRDALAITWTPTYLLVGPDLTIRAFRTDLSVGGESAAQDALAEARSIRQGYETDQRQ